MRTGIVGAVLLSAAPFLAYYSSTQDKPVGPEVRTAPLSVSGKALDEFGRAIKGATVYVVSTNGSPEKLLGQMTSGEDGRYEFRDLPLPEQRFGKPSEAYQHGCFQVFGKAAGKGFAWRGMKFFYSRPRDANAEPQSPDTYRRSGFFADEKIELDLTFAPAKRIYGRFVDEGGKAVAGVKVQLGMCDFVDPTGKESHVNYRDFRSVWQAAEVMPDQLLATSDSEGHFEFNSVPPEIFCWVSTEHSEFANLSLYTTTAETTPSTHDGRAVIPSHIKMTLHPVKSIPILVQLGDTEQPISGVDVSASQSGYTGYSSNGVSDKNGKLTLKLPAGTYQLVGDPPKELDYVRNSLDLVVEQTPSEQPFTLRIQPGCVLILKAVDAATGAGIPDVTFGFEKTEIREGRAHHSWWGVQSHTTRIDNPKSNAAGEVRAVVMPGTGRYGVGFTRLPQGYEPFALEDRRPGRLLDLPAGQTVYEEFKLVKTDK